MGNYFLKYSTWIGQAMINHWLLRVQTESEFVKLGQMEASIILRYPTLHRQFLNGVPIAIGSQLLTLSQKTVRFNCMTFLKAKPNCGQK